MSTRHGRFLWLGVALMWLTGRSRAALVLSDADKASFTCSHPCSPLIDQGVIQQPYSVLIYTNQDANPTATLTSLVVRAPCIRFKQILKVLGSTGGVNLTITGDVVDMEDLKEVPPFRSLLITASELKKSKNEPLDFVKNQGRRDESWSLFDLVGYNAIFDPASDDGSPLWYKAVEPRRAPYSVDLNVGRLTSPTGPFEVINSILAPQLTKVIRAVVSLTKGKQLPLSSEPCSKYLDINTGLPLTCWRTSTQDVSTTNYFVNVYFFRWALDATVSYPLRDRANVYLPPAEILPDTIQTEIYTPTKLRRQSTNAVVNSAEITAVLNTLTSELNRYIRNPNPLLSLPILQQLTNKLTVYAIDTYRPAPELKAVANGVAARPVSLPDSDLLWLLRTCYNIQLDYRQSQTETRSLTVEPRGDVVPLVSHRRTQLASDPTLINSVYHWIELLGNVSNSLSIDMSLFEFSQLYQDATTIYEPGQLEITALSLSTYVETLNTYRTNFEQIIRRVQNTLNFNEAATQRLAAARQALRAEKDAELAALAAYLQQKQKEQDIKNALDAIKASLQQRSNRFASIEPALRKDLNAYLTQESINRAVDVFQGLIGVVGGIVSLQPNKVFEGVGFLISAGAKIAKEVLEYQVLEENIKRVLRINKAYEGINSTNAAADAFTVKLDAALNSADPRIFTDADRASLTGAVFNRSVTQVQGVLLDFRTLRDTVDIMINPFVKTGFSSAKQLGSILREFSNAGLIRVQLELDYGEARNQRLLAGIQYLNAKINTANTEQYLNNNFSPDALRQISINFWQQSLAAKQRVLRLLNQACNAFTYAYLVKCPVPDSVRAGLSDAFTLIDTVNGLAIAFATAASANRPGPFEATVRYNNASLEELRVNRTLTFELQLDNPYLSNFYAINVDSVVLKFDGLSAPSGAEVVVDVTSSGFHRNSDRVRKAYSFRGPSFSRRFVFDDTEIIVPATYYPDDADQFYKPSPYQVWQITVLRRPQNQGQFPNTTIDVSGVSQMNVTFTGRASLY